MCIRDRYYISVLSLGILKAAKSLFHTLSTHTTAFAIAFNPTAAVCRKVQEGCKESALYEWSTSMCLNNNFTRIKLPVCCCCFHSCCFCCSCLWSLRLEHRYFVMGKYIGRQEASEEGRGKGDSGRGGTRMKMRWCKKSNKSKQQHLSHNSITMQQRDVSREWEEKYSTEILLKK